MLYWHNSVSGQVTARSIVVIDETEENEEMALGNESSCSSYYNQPLQKMDNKFCKDILSQLSQTIGFLSIYLYDKHHMQRF